MAAKGRVSSFSTRIDNDRVLGPEHPDTLRVTHNVALTLWYQGDLAAARVLLEQVVETSTRVLGPEHPDTLVAMGSLDHLLAAMDEAAQSDTE